MQTSSLNNDEILQARWSSLPFREMMREVRRDAVHPPLDYLIQFSVGRLGGPDWLRRVPNVVFGIATVGLVMLLGAWWFSPGAGLIAGFLFALTPMHVRYTQEVRPYSSGLFFLLAALVALECYARTRRLRWAIVWAVLVFLTGSTLYFAGMVAGLTSVFRISIDRKENLRILWRWLPAVILTWTLLYSPWLTIVMHVARSPSPKPPDRLDWSWWKFRAQTMATGDWRIEPISLGSWALWSAVLVGIIASVRQRSTRVATVWFVVGGAMQIILLQIHPHYSSPRYLISALPGAFVLAGAGVEVLLRRATTAPIGATMVLLFAGYAALTLDEYHREGRSDWRSVVTYVRERAERGEAVITTNAWVFRNFIYYWREHPDTRGINVERFSPSQRDFIGPAWIVTGQCFPREQLKEVGLMHRFLDTERSEVRYLREGERLAMRDEICPQL